MGVGREKGRVCREEEMALARDLLDICIRKDIYAFVYSF
jgi:hypothetical protein